MRAALIASCLLLVAAECSAAKIYRWTGPDGKVHYGDQSAAGTNDAQRVDTQASTVTQSSKTSPDATPELTPEQQAARAAECKTQRSHLKTYRNATKVVEQDSLGREHEFSAEDRQLLIARTEAEVVKLCGSAEPAEESGDATARAAQ